MCVRWVQGESEQWPDIAIRVGTQNRQSSHRRMKRDESGLGHR
jgi:hypothetical protein